MVSPATNSLALQLAVVLLISGTFLAEGFFMGSEKEGAFINSKSWACQGTTKSTPISLFRHGEDLSSSATAKVGNGTQTRSTENKDLLFVKSFQKVRF